MLRSNRFNDNTSPDLELEGHIKQTIQPAGMWNGWHSKPVQHALEEGRGLKMPET